MKTESCNKVECQPKVLPCLLVKIVCKFPATSCSDSISISDKDKDNDNILTFIYCQNQKQLADSHPVLTLI